MKAHGVVSLLSASVFGAVLVTLHFLEPEFNTGPVSFYSLGTFGLLMRLGFASLGAAFFSLVIGLRSEQRNSGLYYTVLALFLITGAALVLVGLFNTDPRGTSNPSTAAVIHSSAANAWSLACSMGVILFAVAFRRNGEPLRIGRLSRNLGMIILAIWLAGFFLGQFEIFVTVQPRIFFSLVLSWIILVSNQIRTGGLVMGTKL